MNHRRRKLNLKQKEFTSREIVFISGAVVLSLLSVAIHYTFFTVFPDPFFQPDSTGYYNPAFDFIFNKVIQLDSIRTPGYPVFLTLVLMLTKSFTGVLVVQHGLHFLLSFLVGLFFFLFIKRSFVYGFLLFFIMSLLPRSLLYAHTILTENLFSFFYFSALFLFFLNLKLKKNWLWWLISLHVLITITIKPAAYSLLLSIPIGLWLFRTKKKRLAPLLHYGVSQILVLGLFLMISFSVRGFFGFTQKNGEVLFGAAAYYLDLSTLQDGKMAAEFKPIYESHRSKMRHDHAFVMYDPAGPVEALKRINPNAAEVDKILKAMALKAIFSDPFQFVWHRITDLGRYILFASDKPNYFVFPKEQIFWRGFQRYLDNMSVNFPQSSVFIKHRPHNHNQTLRRMMSTSMYPFQTDALVPKLLTPILTYGAWVPLVAMLFAVWLIFKSPFKSHVLFFLTVIFWLLFINNLGGGLDGRYAIPIEPLYLILFFTGLDEVIKKIWLKRA